ncbi:FAD-dependent oxidoreductase [Psychromarinibacter sp. C21-152]|uniref:FAD-dependent oxidoreductase n=1 Tax=Psychromarinibacter sediminicola TaxID=3033385 RepID=A0AAE3TA65_9RHOB|nr:FAD-dependent oxidoreductase [Psychromarinibacter sediminicola]MDF0602947.1 FAD-dependent oxidoreductase [Psychromarinibacter sediminicola]
MMLIGTQVTVVGAGIAGLALARALALRGAEVTVLERADAIREVGAGLQISPNGTAVIDALGLGEALRAAGLVNRAVDLRDYRRGRPVLRMDLARHSDGPHPFVLIHRARLIELLAEGAREAGVSIRLGTEVRPSDPPLPGESLRIGAEGLHSQLRATLNGPERAFFTGQAAWRAVIEDDAPAESHVYMGPGRHLVTYPLGGGLRNIVAVEERELWTEESWSQPDDPENLRRAFAAFAPEVRGWLEKVEAVNIWGLFRHPVAETWVSEGWALLGDAAHPTLPFLAQGANLALEDAWVLAESLNALPAAEALSLYQARRRPRAVRVIEAANGNARNFHLKNPLVRGAAHTVLRLGGTVAPDAALRRFDWLYGHDVTV